MGVVQARFLSLSALVSMSASPGGVEADTSRGSDRGALHPDRVSFFGSTQAATSPLPPASSSDSDAGILSNATVPKVIKRKKKKKRQKGVKVRIGLPPLRIPSDATPAPTDADQTSSSADGGGGARLPRVATSPRPSSDAISTNQQAAITPQPNDAGDDDGGDRLGTLSDTAKRKRNPSLSQRRALAPVSLHLRLSTQIGFVFLL